MKIGNKTRLILRKVFHYSLLVVMFGIGFLTSHFSSKFESPTPKPNPYSNIYSTKDISIAVDASNSLLMVTKNTGEYIVYSDSVGQTIFKMYANRIYQQNVSNTETTNVK